MYIYSSQQIKEIDSTADQQGMSLLALMENAGSGLYRNLIKVIDKNDKVLIFAGKGNNGGDGIVLARYLKNNGYQASLIFPLGMPKTKTAKEHLAYYQACGYDTISFHKELSGDFIIDALLGVGSQLPLRSDLAEMTSWINEQQKQVVAIDLPTGVSSDTGEVDSHAVRAHYTYALHGYKPSAFLFPSSSYYGETMSIDIGLPQKSDWRIWTENDVRQTFSKATGNTHKGTFGNGLLIAGTDEMPGSATLSAIGALRFGIGKLSIATTQHASTIIGSFAPEATFLYEFRNLDYKNFSSIAIGPGLKPDETLEKRINEILQLTMPVILDAGAINPRNYPKRIAPTILTPHPGEFSRIAGKSSREIQGNRIELASQYAREQQVIIILKGSYTVIAFPDGTGFISTSGNRALSKGGSGDTLTGMLLASLHNHDTVKEAVANAVYIHGACADQWVKSHGEQTMAAHDFDTLLPERCYYFSH